MESALLRLGLFNFFLSFPLMSQLKTFTFIFWLGQYEKAGMPLK